jgi:hypothetical protein
VFSRFSLRQPVPPFLLNIFIQKGNNMKNIKQLTAVARPLAAAMALAGLAAFTLSGCGEATGKAAEAPAQAVRRSRLPPLSRKPSMRPRSFRAAWKRSNGADPSARRRLHHRDQLQAGQPGQERATCCS